MSAANSPLQVADAAPGGEAERIGALRRYQILDTPAEPAFDRIVRIAALLLDVPVALISLVDVERQWFKARYGVDVAETPRAIAFCDRAIRGDDILVVPDAESDPRFSENPLVTGAMHVRFYAGAPLKTPDGFALGTICAMDRVPRQLKPRDAAILEALAEQVVHELEMRSAMGELYQEVAGGRRTARTLRGEEAKLEALLNFTENAVIMTDTDGQVASLNRAARVMFGFEPGESLGVPVAGLICDEVASADADAAGRSSVGNGRRKDGSEFPVEVSRASWLDAEGCTASAAMVRDITERRLAEAEARRHNAAVHTHDKLAALGRTAGGVAHELNNLLQPIIGLTQLELDQLPSEGTEEQMESRESLATILESGNQARDVVRKLLMFARKAKPELTPLDFSAALARATASVGKKLPPGVHVDSVIDDSAVGLANINETELAEVLNNLVANAADAMGGRGTVTIRADRLELPDPASLGMAAGADFLISVTDTGCGIDAETRAQIFEPFFTTKPVGQGTGLGLSIAYGVLRDWKGAIAVDSSPGCGSSFTIYVPVIQTS